MQATLAAIPIASSCEQRKKEALREWCGVGARIWLLSPAGRSECAYIRGLSFLFYIYMWASLLFDNHLAVTYLSG